MSRKKKVEVQIVPVSEAALIPKTPSADLKAVIESMVRKRMDEILSASCMAEIDPDFRPRESAQVTRRAQDMFEREKWALYFAKWGCRKCDKKTVNHASTGHCAACNTRLWARLARIKRDYHLAHPDAEIERQIDRLTSRSRIAEALLRRDNG
jgi:hypothetical protein